jgi:peptidoglycan hydrolase CwlO-like protein
MKIKSVKKVLNVFYIFLFIILGCQYQENTKISDFQKEIKKLKKEVSDISEKLTKLSLGISHCLICG